MIGRRSNFLVRVSTYFWAGGLFLLFALFSTPAPAQSYQTWPEISTYVNLNPNTRLYFIATQTKESRQGTDAEIGPNLDFYFKPLFKANKGVIFQPDQSKSRPLLLFPYANIPRLSPTMSIRTIRVNRRIAKSMLSDSL